MPSPLRSDFRYLRSFVDAVLVWLDSQDAAEVAAREAAIAALTGQLNTLTTTTGDSLALKAPLASPAFTGTPTAPTQAAGNNTTRLATTAFVQAATAAAVTGYATVAYVDSGLAAKATTAYVDSGLAGKANSSHNHAAGDITSGTLGVSRIGSGTPGAGKYVDGGTGAWTSLPAAPDLSGYAPLNSPVFTGSPNSTTPSNTSNSNRIATTAFVQAVVAGVTGGAPSNFPGPYETDSEAAGGGVAVGELYYRSTGSIYQRLS